MPDIHAARRQALRAQLPDLGADAALISRLVNVRYLTGFTGSAAALLVGPDGACLATDGRYTTQAAAEAPDVQRLIERSMLTALASRAGPGQRLAFEAHEVTVTVHRALATATDAELVELGPAVEAMRAVKDEAELDALRSAAAIADRAFAELLPAIAAGRTERELAVELEDRMRAHGSDGVAFETICAAGPNGAIPHHRPTDRAVGSGELVTFDFGARLGGYHSDMTRTVALRPAADWQRDLYRLVAESQRAGRHRLAVGVACAEVDATCRAVIAAAGHGEHFTHGTGHGIGLEIHEAPNLGQQATGTLDERVPVTVEPGVYLPGQGGVRIEDTLVVRGNGPELLTTTTKELLVL